jgi:hypothetical protein
MCNDGPVANLLRATGVGHRRIESRIAMTRPLGLPCFFHHSLTDTNGIFMPFLKKSPAAVHRAAAGD